MTKFGASEGQPRETADQQLVVATSNLQSLDIDVKDLTADLVFGVDESYTLDIPSRGGRATLQANTVWGALRGLETFAQLVQASQDGLAIEDFTEEEQMNDAPFDFEGLYIPETPIHIEDAPKFSHRGLMLGTPFTMERTVICDIFTPGLQIPLAITFQ